ncbi:MAG: type II toxin-antitoxin system VapC family toxin [Rhodobacteraceae bacterium]|uniref:type II toxin-antitoxin system VapC family toxin n=2 Tax=Acetobacterales TaxID=3120395 RepID=UPI00042856D5|nr:type II toxin-antitoxin system VapC family toxin [Rubritepida flocculans]MBX6383002.1 type II toxin-antitoxin system VapC family toxin [Microbispora sp.]MCX7644913.1 type II toxin-antitoxin system VapC family toxin [Paracoccaceae bacterium]
MRLLLDTHVLLWFAAGDEQLGRKARAAIADPGNTVLVSVVSLWEAAIKVRIGKLEVDVPALIRESVRAGFDLLDLTPGHVERLLTLPVSDHHRNPFDHLLLAQAAAEGATFVTDDRHAKRYGVPILRSW